MRDVAEYLFGMFMYGVMAAGIFMGGNVGILSAIVAWVLIVVCVVNILFVPEGIKYKNRPLPIKLFSWTIFFGIWGIAVWKGSILIFVTFFLCGICTFVQDSRWKKNNYIAEEDR